MDPNFTEYQTSGEQMRAEEMSRVPTVPPAQVSGYRIDRLLGRGAFGQVWIGVDRNTGRNVAIKFYIHHSKMDWQLLSREVRHLVSMAADRNIVQVLAVGWDHEPPYYVMEYLENGSLEDLIRRKGRLPVDEALRIFNGVLAALKHSHGRGILHCDLKPANILLDAQMAPRIADFGQSRMSDEQSPSLGTLFYMAPEQADMNAMPDARWDVYALGALLYCLIVGEPPYFSSDRVTTLRTAKDLPERLTVYRQMIHSAPVPRAHWRVKSVDKDLAKIIDRMLVRLPENRYENVQQVIDALQDRAQSQMRKPLMLLGGVGPLLLLGVMSLFFWRGVSTAKEQSTVRLQQEASRSNHFAASLAARTMERDIATLYQLVETEAGRPSMHTRLVDTLASFTAQQWEQLVAIRPPDVLQGLLVGDEKRQELERHLEESFKKLNAEERQVHDAAQIDSIFILDERGTMIATALADKKEATPRIGWNFAYRGYFNGESQDYRVTDDRSKLKPYEVTHLSPPFKSTTTDKWKIAISTPIFIGSENSSEAKENSATTEAQEIARTIRGVLVMTINLGDFELLGNEGELSSAGDNSQPSASVASDRFAVLIDGRSGDQEGTLVQHPLLSELADSTRSQSDVADATSYRIEPERLAGLRRGGVLDYRDPLAAHPAGAKYAGLWIATLERIRLPMRGPREDTALRAPASDRELLVLVQEPASKTAVPVQQLVDSMTREFAIALAVVLAVIGSLWYFGIRMFRVVQTVDRR